MIKHGNLLIKIFLCSVLLLAMTACDDDDTEAIDIPIAYVSLFNASPDAPSLSIVVDGRQINRYPFDYAARRGYYQFYTGDRDLEFGPYDADNVQLDSTVTFDESKAYSIFLADEYDDLSLVVLEDNFQAISAEDKGMIRFINLSPDAQAIDLNVAGEDTPVFSVAAFKDYTDFTEVDADTYTFEIKSSKTGEVLLTVPDIDIPAGWYATIVVRGYETPPVGSSRVLSAEVVVNKS